RRIQLGVLPVADVPYDAEQLVAVAPDDAGFVEAALVLEVETVLDALRLVARPRALEGALEDLGERRRQDVAHGLAEERLGRDEERPGILDVTVEIHPVLAVHEHPIRDCAQDGAAPLLALTQRFL